GRPDAGAQPNAARRLLRRGRRAPGDCRRASSSFCGCCAALVDFSLERRAKSHRLPGESRRVAWIPLLFCAPARNSETIVSEFEEILFQRKELAREVRFVQNEPCWSCLRAAGRCCSLWH